MGGITKAIGGVFDTIFGGGSKPAAPTPPPAPPPPAPMPTMNDQAAKDAAKKQAAAMAQSSGRMSTILTSTDSGTDKLG
jgi:hypothetical protein